MELLELPDEMLECIIDKLYTDLIGCVSILSLQRTCKLLNNIIKQGKYKNHNRSATGFQFFNRNTQMQFNVSDYKSFIQQKYSNDPYITTLIHVVEYDRQESTIIRILDAERYDNLEFDISNDDFQFLWPNRKCYDIIHLDCRAKTFGHFSKSHFKPFDKIKSDVLNNYISKYYLVQLHHLWETINNERNSDKTDKTDKTDKGDMTDMTDMTKIAIFIGDDNINDVFTELFKTGRLAVECQSGREALFNVLAVLSMSQSFWGNQEYRYDYCSSFLDVGSEYDLEYKFDDLCDSIDDLCNSTNGIIAIFAPNEKVRANHTFRDMACKIPRILTFQEIGQMLLDHIKQGYTNIIENPSDFATV